MVGLAAVLAYILGVAGVWLALSRRWSIETARAFGLALGIAAVIFAAGIFVFDAFVSRYRSVDGHERRGAQLDDFLFLSKVGLLALYTLVILAGACVGYALGRRLAGQAALVAVAAGMGVAGLIAATFPIVEYQNSCFAGQPLILDRYIACG